MLLSTESRVQTLLNIKPQHGNILCKSQSHKTIEHIKILPDKIIETSNIIERRQHEKLSTINI